MGPNYRSTSPRRPNPSFSHLPLHSPTTPSSPTWSLKLPASRQNSVLRVLTLVAALSTFFYLTSSPAETTSADLLALREAAEDKAYQDSLWSFQRTKRATTEGSFTDYLDSHFPLDSPKYPPPHLWITLADQGFMPGAENLDVFVRQLNEERRGKFGRRARETVVVTLCLDEGCLEVCQKRGMYCYGGFESTRPEKVCSFPPVFSSSVF
jgi:hypothetical protein